MSVTWSQPPASGRTIRVSELGSLGENLGQDNGESRRVCRVPRFPGWLLKEYRAPLTLGRARRLERLIWLPSQMVSADLDLVNGHTAWPAAQVVNPDGKTIGALIPLAPDSYSYTWKLPSGRIQDRMLEVDMLALSEADQRGRNFPPQSLADRVAVCASIAAVGALFERHDLVYLDWSWANVFWSHRDHDAYVIDMDGCSFGPRPQIQSPHWEDPLVPMGNSAGKGSDRYRLALLIARCLTGTRADIAATETALQDLRANSGVEIGRVVQLVIQAIRAPSVEPRPTLTKVSEALEAAMATHAGSAAANNGAAANGTTVNGNVTGGVKTWKPLIPRTAATSAPAFNSANFTSRTPSYTMPRSATWNSPSAGAPTSPSAKPMYQARQTWQPQNPSKGGSRAGVVALVLLVLLVLGIILAIIV